jgi:aspartyl-tRNA(Asn)/glutamyl-tRNA(Gln) amidotransferase subunit C
MEHDEVRRVAELARLEIPDRDLARTATELSAVLEFVAALRRLDLSGCEPMSFAPAEACLRADALDARRLTAEQATAAAPASEDGFFLVPPIVENLQP